MHGVVCDFIYDFCALQVFDEEGSFLSHVDTSAAPLFGPQSIYATRDNTVLVADSGNHCVKIFRYETTQTLGLGLSPEMSILVYLPILVYFYQCIYLFIVPNICIYLCSLTIHFLCAYVYYICHHTKHVSYIVIVLKLCVCVAYVTKMVTYANNYIILPLAQAVTTISYAYLFN